MNYSRIFCSNVVIALVILMLASLASSLVAQPLAEGHNKFLGCIISGNVPADFDDYWNQVTPENAGKWGSVEATRNVYNWNNLDRAYQHSRDMGYPFRLHVLVWGKQQPAWITDLDSLEQAEEVEEWIMMVGDRYPDLEYVEVVNEAIEWSTYDYYPSYYKALGGEGETGWDWVIWAFEKAREYFPNSKLLLNEYQIFGGNKSITTYLKIINLLKERNLIDGICEQGHFLENTSAKTIQTRLDKLAETGLPIQITEFDLQFEDDDQQLAKYQAIFPTLWSHPAVEGITFWGYKQGTLWRTDAYLVRADGTERPALEWLRQYLAETVNVNDKKIYLPTGFNLDQNFPNPFNPSTSIHYSLSHTGNVSLTVYNLQGQKIRTLENAMKQSGQYSVVWDATDDNRNPVASGIYIGVLNNGTTTRQIKMTLVR